jgi:ATP-dependent DNA helicase RecG
MLDLSTPVFNLRMVGPIYSSRLKKLGITTVSDLLYHLPFRYEDYSVISKINLLKVGERVTILGKIQSFKNIYTKHGKKIQKAILADETGQIEIVWYNQPFLKNILKEGSTLSICGEAKWFGNSLSFESPEYEIVKQTTGRLIHTGKLVPIYPETAGVSSKWLRSRIYNLLYKWTPTISEDLPFFILRENHLIGKREAIYRAHFPRSKKDIEEAKRRLSFDELLILQLAAQKRQKEWQEKKVSFLFSVHKYLPQIEKFIDNLPFELTFSQQKAVNDLLTDLEKEKPMNRLLEGDVGSGKTVVATIAMFVAHLNGFQSVFMAPTEILANQHFFTIGSLLKPYKIKTKIMTGSTKNKDKLKERSFDILVGTHALLSEKLKLKKLGLVIIDEQQRFGVSQRALLREKGTNPHVLTLTATPIPRTIALTLYVDLDLSVIDELPKGRQLVKTWVVPPEKREAAYQWIQKQIEKSNHQNQAFIICPLIEESENLLTVKAATVEYERLKNDIFPKLQLGLLHGRMKNKDKDQMMIKLKNKKLDILVATPVVEVGIDIPSATIMMIEGSERFGLSQLHQLRGRVGRNHQQSYCLLFTDSTKSKVMERLKYLETIFSGPKLAELDLKLRGFGELFGTRQHGNLGLKIADITDLSLIEETRRATAVILSKDEKLSGFPLLKEKVEKYKIERVAPD